MKRITALIILLLLVFLTGCDNVQTDFDSISSYKDIPGVTEEEIAAVEALKEQWYRFSYGHLFETESFRLSDGTYAGFTIEVCNLLSELFDKEFTPVHYYDWELLKQGIDDLSIDFSGDFSTTTEQQALYYMTTPIAGRTLKLYTLKDSDDIESESDVNGLTIGFLAETVTARIISEAYPELSFEAVEIAKISGAADMLKSGEIDAFVMDGVMDLEFERYEFVKSKNFFALVSTPVSITTANPELQPLISVINKYLAAGGINKLFELYYEGEYEYTKYKLHQSFTDEETAYLNELASQNAKVNIGIQHDVYPVSFYNEMDEEYEGIALDVLGELTTLTGIEFEAVTTSETTPLSEILAKLRAGEISMMTQLLYTESRQDDYLWSAIPYHTTNYALLSRTDYTDLEPYEVFYVTVGTLVGSAHEEMFETWFPGHEHQIKYATSDEGFTALENGEIDLLMLSENMLLALTNYREKPGFKINISFNKTLDSLFGYSKDQTILCSIVDKALYHIDTDKISREWLNRTFDYSKEIAQMQTIYVSVFAIAVVVVLIAITLLFLKNKRLGKRLLVAVDEAQEASKVKSQFLANMSHEIRTPMNVIVGMSEILLNEPLTSQQQSCVSDINISSHSLLGIINDILDFSKIEAGKLDLVPIDYDFEEFVGNICSMFEYVAQGKMLDFKFETVGELPKYLFGDDIRLRQVLTNICGNAVKFTSEGFIRLGITSTDETLAFDIEDTGIGIREEDLPKLFNAFIQADTQKNRSIKGTGLGLAISKSFVEMMGGTITIASVYGQGTTFTVTIPKIAGNEDAVKRDNKTEREFYAPTAKILVVDDNELNLKVASGLLNLLKINAVTVQSGDEAITLIKETDYDIVFMDHMMPVKDGIETTREIRELGGKYEDLIIVALTANAIRGAKEMFLNSGFNGFVSKPIEMNELTEALRKLLPPEKMEEQTQSEPPEAGEKNNEAEVQDGEDSEFLTAMKQISEINTEIGLSRLSNMEDMYRETVELFYKKLLPSCDKMEGFVKNEELHDFSITVHSMKSTLATIGAVSLSEEALKLEMASKEENLQYCVEQLPGLVTQLRLLHGEMSAAFPDEEPVSSQSTGNIEDLREGIQTALTAADDFDGDSGMEVISKLLEHDFGAQNNSLLESAKTAFKDFEFDAAIDCLNRIVV